MTTTAIDTSVAVPLLVCSHQCHAPVALWARGRTLSLCGHALAETYSVLTRLPGDARLAPADAVALIDENFPGPRAAWSASLAVGPSRVRTARYRRRCGI